SATLAMLFARRWRDVRRRRMRTMPAYAMTSPTPLPCYHAATGSGNAVASTLPVPPPRARWMSPVTLALKLLGFGVYGASAGNEADEPLGVVNVMAGRIHSTRRFVRRIADRFARQRFD